MFFSQRDPQWADLRLGTSRVTIGSYGCALNAACGVLASIGCGCAMTPAALNRWLARNNGFASGNLLVFGALAPLGVELDAVIDCYRQPAPMATVERARAEGREVLALVDFDPGGGVQQHWVRLGDAESCDLPGQPAYSDYWIHDPWMPTGYTWLRLLPRYAAHSWPNAARAIFRLAIYRLADMEPLMRGLEAQALGQHHQRRLYPRAGTGWVERLRAWLR